MRIRLTIVLAMSALAAAAPAAQAAQHVFRFRATGGAGHLITRLSYYYNQTLHFGGRQVGRIHAVCRTERGSSPCNLTIYLHGGTLHAHWRVAGYYVKGKVTGGTGRLRGARGQIVQDARGEPTYPDGSGVSRITITLQRI